MANVLGNYNPSFFANEALIQLYKALGMAGRVHRGLDADRAAAGRNRGDTINIRRPAHFSAATHVAGTGTTAQDIEGQNVQVTLDQHKEVKFGVSDVELAYSGDRIIQEHIRPAAYALADDIDQALHALGAKVGPKHIVSGSVDSGFITGPRKVLRNNKCPMGMDVSYLVDSGMEAAFLDLGIFHEARIVGDGNQEALRDGTLGRRFGVEVFASQNADISVSALSSTASASGSGDKLGAVNGAVAVNVSSIVVDSFTGTETVQVGDTFTIAGDETVYILTAATTFAGGAGTLTFYPPLRKSAADNAVVTLGTLNAVEEAAHYRNLMFHKNAFALAFAPLPNTGDGRGAEISTVVDPDTGLAIRARMYYNGDTATNMVALDVLYGVQVLDPMLAVRVLRATGIAPAS